MSRSIDCPKCGDAASHVVDSRPQHIPVPNVMRWRKCRCGHRYKTREFIDDLNFASFIDGRGLSGRDLAVVSATISAMRSTNSKGSRGG